MQCLYCGEPTLSNTCICGSESCQALKMTSACDNSVSDMVRLKGVHLCKLLIDISSKCVMSPSHASRTFPFPAVFVPIGEYNFAHDTGHDIPDHYFNKLTSVAKHTIDEVKTFLSNALELTDIELYRKWSDVYLWIRFILLSNHVSM